MIKRATLDDVAEAARMGMAFNQSSRWPMGTTSLWQAHMERSIRDPDQAVFLSDGGVISGGIVDWPWAENHRSAHETAWWSCDGKGLALLLPYEDWARSKGARDVNVSFLASDKAPKAIRALNRRGYEVSEIGFRKVL